MPIRSQFKTEEEWLEHLHLWFTGMALMGRTAAIKDWMDLNEIAKMVAKVTYVFADAMLKEREKSESTEPTS